MTPYANVINVIINVIIILITIYPHPRASLHDTRPLALSHRLVRVSMSVETYCSRPPSSMSPPSRGSLALAAALPCDGPRGGGLLLLQGGGHTVIGRDRDVGSGRRRATVSGSAVDLDGNRIRVLV
jgi:hypothetical protein